jgi:hypothetical protein
MAVCDERGDGCGWVDQLRQAVLDLCSAAHHDLVPVEELLDRLKASLAGDDRFDADGSGTRDIIRSRVVALTIAGYYAGARAH